MPIRIASLSEQISANGQALHRAMMMRAQADATHTEPSEAERVLIEERRLLKEERSRRHAQAMQPRAKAADRLLRTHHPEAKDKPKVKTDAHASKDAKAAKPHKSRAEKHAAKAAALDAARKTKRPAK